MNLRAAGMTNLRAVLWGLLCSLLLAAAAQAHAVLRSAEPADGSLLAAPPEAVHLRFNEAVRPLAIRLTAPDGVETDLTAQVPGGADLAVPLPALARGTHVVSWRVASDDGHPVAGALLFSVGAAGGAAAAADGAPGLRAGLWLARFAMTAGLVLGVGGALFLAFAGPVARARRPVALACLAGLGAAPVCLGLHGLDALGLGWAALATRPPWAAGWATGFGPSVALACMAAVLALLSLRRRMLAWAAPLLLALSYAASGHAGAAEPRWLTRPLVFLHLAALTFWIGALIPLALSRTPQALRRFSAAIPPVLAVLLVSGAVLAVVQLGGEMRGFLTPYGAILAAKLAALAALLALAAVNRWQLTGPALRGRPDATARLRRSIGTEVLLAVLILGLTAGWRFTPPPRALSPAAPPAFTHLHSDAVMANLQLTPGAAGPVAALVEVTDTDLNPVEPLSVTLALSLPERGIEGLTRPAEPLLGQPGLWTVPDLLLPQPGLWLVEMEVRVTRFQLVRLSGEIALR